MELDEDGTHARYIFHRRDLIDPLIREHHGRIVKSTGDGLLAEFRSAAQCLRCALKVQDGMTRCNTERDGTRQIRFRIGINFGNVIVEKDDIYGDGVNVAARIQSLASPGGIAISLAAVQEFRADVKIDLDDLGPLILKETTRPIRVFRFPSTRC
jgi:adenylate cyclase